MIPLLAMVFRDPAVATTLTAAQWCELLPQLKDAGVLGHLAELLADAKIDVAACPPAVQRQLLAHRTAALSLTRRARWESGEIARAFAGSGVDVMLLKGASYVVSGALPGRGRFTGDVDVLVRRDALADAERLLRAANWLPVETAPEEAEFVRAWEHQLPPFQHVERLTMVDLHHTVIAPGGGHRVDVDQLFRCGRPVGAPALLVPSDLDQCLIVAAHFLRSGSAASAFRDLLDFTELLGACGEPATVCTRLAERARAIGLGRALAVTGGFAAELFGTPTFGPRPFLVGIRAAALLPAGAGRFSRTGRVLRRLHGIATTRAAVPWRVMLARTVRRRLRGAPAPIR